VQAGRRWRRSLVLASSLLLGSAAPAACSGDPAPPVRSPSPFFGPTGATDVGVTGGGTTGAGASGPAGGTRATGTTGSLSRGSISLRVSGDIRLERTLRELVSAVYSPPPGGVALVWTAGGTDPSTVGLGGASFVGSHPTAPALTLTITVPSPRGGFETFTSLGGECTVTLDRATASAISGSFRCDDLGSATGATVGVTATFSASR
jgi:hypothetical protein